MRRKLFISLSVLLLIALSIGIFSYQQQKEIVLNFGMFAGSNWDVPNGNTYKIIDDVIERFEAQHPNVRVEYVSGIQKRDYAEWLSSQAIQGDLPDVFMVRSDDISTFAQIGMLEDVNSYMKRDDTIDKEQFFTPSLAAGMWKDGQYGLPYEVVPTLMYVNKTLLEKEGIEIPSQDWTWDDFYEICKAVTKDTNNDGMLDQFGVYGYTWQNAIASNGATVFSEDGKTATLADSKAYEAIAFTRKLEALSGSQTLTSEMFDRGDVVFCPMSFSEYRTYKPYPWRVKKYSSFEWDCIPMPKGENGANVSQLDTLYMGMSANSSKKKLAWEFMKMLCADTTTQVEIFQYSQGVSVLKDLTNSDEALTYLEADSPQDSTFHLDFLSDVMEHAIVVRKFSDYDQVVSVADSEIRRLLKTDEEIITAINSLQTKLNLMLQK